ncbi:MAG: 8-amino-7-oxononanoate synthase [Chloroflexaceae bacterium]|nr:8-amino-7-oxononanoate synthase [Chloroflexaceae bacterium]
MASAYDWLAHSLETLHQAHWYRSVQAVTSGPGPVIQIDGRWLINFASNDYLGLAGDRRLIEAAVAAIRTWGTGSTGSRLLSGHRPLHQDLETQIAALKQTEAAIAFSSGYLANLGTIAALVGQRDLILADRYNHASLKQGAKLSGARVIEYEHNNVLDLREKLQHRKRYRRCLIVSDSVFSMDGDLCPLPELLALGDTWNCMVLVDEAHATGVLGATGAGCVEAFGCTGRELVQVGTLSKALGSLGGYVAGSAKLIDYLRNRASSWIYTTALSPADTAAALAGILLVQAEPERREKLWQNTTRLKAQLLDLGADLLPSESPIIGLKLPNPERALQLSQTLKLAGIFAPAIRPPTVPTSRLRFSVMATHEPDRIDRLIAVLKAAKFGVAE